MSGSGCAVFIVTAGDFAFYVDFRVGKAQAACLYEACPLQRLQTEGINIVSGSTLVAATKNQQALSLCIKCCPTPAVDDVGDIF